MSAAPSRRAPSGPAATIRWSTPATPVGENRTIVVHHGIDAAEARAVAPSRAAAMRRLAADMADATAVLRTFVGSRRLVTMQRTENARHLGVEVSSNMRDGMSVRLWHVASADADRPDDALEIALPLLPGIAAAVPPDALHLQQLAPIVAHAADVLERPGDHPSEREWSDALRVLLVPLQSRSEPEPDMVRNADHLSRSPLSLGRTSVAKHWSRQPWTNPVDVFEPQCVDAPDGMLLTMEGPTLVPRLQSIATHLHHDAIPDTMTALRALAAMEEHPLWKAHRERTRHP
jgi:hypothetical protein